MHEEPKGALEKNIRPQGCLAESERMMGVIPGHGDPGLGARYRLALAISAELWAASASCAEILAVSAGLPQLGASLPSPQARGR